MECSTALFVSQRETMQTLDFTLDDLRKHKEYEIPKESTGLNFSVDDDKEGVTLTIGGRAISLTVAGARDLALALRQSSNRVERQLHNR
jgi:hypothetical protein